MDPYVKGVLEDEIRNYEHWIKDYQKDIDRLQSYLDDYQERINDTVSKQHELKLKIFKIKEFLENN